MKKKIKKFEGNHQGRNDHDYNICKQCEIKSHTVWDILSIWDNIRTQLQSWIEKSVQNRKKNRKDEIPSSKAKWKIKQNDETIQKLLSEIYWYVEKDKRIKL